MLLLLMGNLMGNAGGEGFLQNLINYFVVWKRRRRA